ncbi:HNH endonuclease [Lysinibacillus sp. NPDC097195]|uniref:HNH endonuclease signature motif containing protein n=1 Tax=Lysinibacillus sp. NPDC097195 TaxID=3364141 RepID=UPI00382BAA6D
MKKLVISLLILVFIVSIPPTFLVSSSVLELEHVSHEEDYLEAAIQLQKLYELGYIDEYITEEDLRAEFQDDFNLINEEYILGEGTYLVAIDTETDEIIDINELIDNKSQINTFSRNAYSDNISKYNSLLVYSVAFKTWITDAGTTTSKINHSAEVTGVYGIGKRPNNYTIIASIQRATSENGSYINADNTTKTVALKQVVTISAYINSTYYWKSDSIAYANYPNATYRASAKNEGPWLLNKKGMKYPEYTDPKSKKVMTKPATTTWSANSSSSCALTSSDRVAYRTWYDKTYGSLNWNDYEIHHIRPCKWGGNKDYSNLIPLPYSFHRATVSPWWVNY